MINARLDSVVKRLLLIRGLRSLGQGAMVVDLTLYLKDLKWSGSSIGGVTTAAGLCGAALILAVGIMSDRLGRKPFLLVYEALTMMAAAAACLTTSAMVLVLAIVVAGFGRGQSGAAGPFSPAEQAWLARLVSHAERGLVFSLNSAIGFFGMSVGCLIGGIPTLIHAAHPLTSYRPVFVIVGAVSFLCMILLLGMKETPPDREPAPTESTKPEETNEATNPAAVTGESATETATETKPSAALAFIAGLPPAENENGAGGTNGEFQFSGEPQAEKSPQVSRDDAARHAAHVEAAIWKRENLAMLKIALVNAINGLAVGLTGPMMAYWFSLRYGVSTAAIGVTLSLGFLLTGFSSIVNGLLARRIGMVKSITAMRVVGSSLMLALPWMPTYGLASLLYVLRGAINRGTSGNRFAVGASLTRDHRRGLATSVNSLSMRLPSSIGPTITGYLFDAGQLSLPLLLTGFLQLANAGLYQLVFGRYDKEDTSAPR